MKIPDDKIFDKKILKINFSGASSTGKSTISEYCAKLYGEPNAPEFIRELMLKRGMVVTDIQNELFLEALELQENDIKRKQNEANKYLFIGSGPLIFYLGNKYSFGRDFPILKEKTLAFYKEQDIVFVCDKNIEFASHVTRGDEGTKDILHYEILKFLDEHSIKYTIISGTVEERAEAVKKRIEEFEINQKSISVSNNEHIKNLPGSLRLLLKAYLETDASDEQKQEVTKRIFETYKYFLALKKGINIEITPNIKIIKELTLLQENGALNNELDIKNAEVFKKSDIVRFSAGLGTFKDLTRTPSMKKCSSLQLKSLREKENE